MIQTTASNEKLHNEKLHNDMKQSRLLILAVFVCWLLPWGSLMAQDTFKPEFVLGVNGGITSSRINFTPRVAQVSLQQYSGGVAARYISEKHFGLQAELNLSQRGWEELKDSVPEHKYTKSLLYAELPVMTHIYFDLGSRVRMIFNLGPQIGYQISESVLANDVHYEPGLAPSAGEPTPVQYTNKTEQLFDWGITGGGGFELRTGIGSFALEGRYYFGLSDIYRNRKSDYYAASPHQVVNVKLTYFFYNK